MGVKDEEVSSIYSWINIVTLDGKRFSGRNVAIEHNLKFPQDFKWLYNKEGKWIEGANGGKR